MLWCLKSHVGLKWLILFLIVEKQTRIFISAIYWLSAITWKLAFYQPWFNIGAPVVKCVIYVQINVFKQVSRTLPLLVGQTETHNTG